MTEPSRAGALRACAAGFYPSEAACELLIATCWLERNDFTPYITAGVSISDGVTPMAAVSWANAISALDTGHLPCSGAERRLLRLAASLGEGIPVDLQDAVTGLDHANLARVISAIRHAAGHRPASMTPEH
jgi:hypothetical protein